MTNWAPKEPEGDSESDDEMCYYSQFRVGADVRLRGFIADYTWNGAEGVLEGRDEESGLFCVRLVDGRIKKVAFENLEPNGPRKWNLPKRAATASPSVGSHRRVTAEAAAAARPATTMVLQSVHLPTPATALYHARAMQARGQADAEIAEVGSESGSTRPQTVPADSPADSASPWLSRLATPLRDVRSSLSQTRPPALRRKEVFVSRKLCALETGLS